MLFENAKPGDGNYDRVVNASVQNTLAMTMGQWHDILTDAYLKLRVIPAERWIDGVWVREENKQCCMLGHYARLTSETPDIYSIDNCANVSVDGTLRTIFSGLNLHPPEDYNDNKNVFLYNEYDNPNNHDLNTPRGRSLAALEIALNTLCDNFNSNPNVANLSYRDAKRFLV